VNVAINGIGALGGFGCGIAALEQALVGSPPPGQWVDFDTTRGPVRVPGLVADTGPLAAYVDKRTLRRMDHSNRIALLAAFLALVDADMFEPRQRGRLGIMVATGYGATCNNFDFQHLSSDGADFSGSPTKFSNSVHNAAAAYISIALGENGPNHSISHLDMSFPSAILSAAQWLREERVDTVLVGGTDEFCKALAFEWYGNHLTTAHKNQALPLTGVPPLVGEGACFFVLSRAQDGQAPYGVIQQAGLERWAGQPSAPPRANAYIVSANRSQQRRCLADRLPAAALVAEYSHIYGTLPVGAAFDLAIAALCLKHSQLFAPQSPQSLFQAVPPGASSQAPLAKGPICCFQLGVGATAGWVLLNETVDSGQGAA
jgi:3-oxoacyl-[acyl-carrier-protein] synthase II